MEIVINIEASSTVLCPSLRVDPRSVGPVL
jgi:hypothetical protein